MFTYIVSELGLMFLGGRLGAAAACRDGWEAGGGGGNCVAECGGGTGGESAAEEGAICFKPSFLRPEKKQNRENLSSRQLKKEPRCLHEVLG